MDVIARLRKIQSEIDFFRDIGIELPSVRIVITERSLKSPVVAAATFLRGCAAGHFAHEKLERAELLQRIEQEKLEGNAEEVVLEDLVGIEDATKAQIVEAAIQNWNIHARPLVPDGTLEVNGQAIAKSKVINRLNDLIHLVTTAINECAALVPDSHFVHREAPPAQSNRVQLPLGDTGLPIVRGAPCFSVDPKGRFTIKPREVRRLAWDRVPRSESGWGSTKEKLDLAKIVVSFVNTVERDFVKRTRTELPDEFREVLVSEALDIFAGIANYQRYDCRGTGAKLHSFLVEKAVGSTSLSARNLQAITDGALFSRGW